MSYKSKLSGFTLAALLVVCLLSTYYAIAAQSSHAKWVASGCAIAMVGIVGYRVILKKPK